MKYGLFKPDTFKPVINTTAQINSAPVQNLNNSITSHVSKPIAAEHKLIIVELVDKLIDLYLERNKTILPGFNSVLLTVVKSNEKYLVEIHLSWPEFFKNFKIHVYAKPGFNNTIRMERIIRILWGKLKERLF